ncbi:DNA polymerase [Spodoptera litura nucleopolyhedrovirus]|uniref:DNA-directed DNA polymerase n=1 Tax=Spodoptera litura multicapsid nucleopolyhedrovirus TaxID=46242 RepID=Q91BF6_NPVST|nr:DNA polymerase [Spodoptera litura nucleopolyhedrovirus]AAL01751.1 DNA polymerase [Spodoptera litura nucleopolyhedrovirus]QHN73918.1 dpol [Spodoptera litura nucleopolyhedrovirus]
MKVKIQNFYQLQREMAADNGCRKGDVVISTRDVFRITRMCYRNKSLYVFMTGYLESDPDRVFQFYMRSPCVLYSYRACYNVHMNSSCRCRSYKTLVVPGLSGFGCDKINVVKYARYEANAYAGRKRNDCADYFLKDINRVHMQLGIVEGNYVKFVRNQTVHDNALQGTYKDLIVVDAESLEREIPAVISCYDIETYTNGMRMSAPETDHIISISIVTRRDRSYKKICFYYTTQGPARDLIDGDGDDETVHVVYFDSEKRMIKAFFDLMPVLNFDYLIDYNGDAFDMPFLMGRSTALSDVKVKRYDLDPVNVDTELLWDKFQNKLNTHHLTYYVHIDLYQFLSSDSEQNDVENFRLNTVAQHYLNDTKVDLKISDMISMYRENRMLKIIEYNVHDAVLPIEIFSKLEIIEFMYTQCTVLFLCTDDALKNISHKVSVVLFQKSLTNVRHDGTPDPYFFNKSDLNVTSGRSGGGGDRQIVDLTQLNRKCIVPTNMIPQTAIKLCARRERCVYKGGKVIAPIPGMYRSVVTLDFNSLYLNIMKNEGICLSNVFIASDNNVYLNKNRDAVNPKLLEELLHLRSVYKDSRDRYPKTSFKYNLYDKMQNAVKRIANSIYGYFGIYFKPLANFVTHIGREKLSDAIKKIESMSNDATILEDFGLSRIKFRVVYGDTDSSFIQVDYESNEIDETLRHETVERIVNGYVLKKLNASWDGYKMALENVMQSLILLKKKKYCYLNTENRIKYKGWLVKKDMPIFMRKSFRSCVDKLLMGHSVSCSMETLKRMLIESYQNFNASNMADYCFSMTYNENPGGKKRTSSTFIDELCEDVLIQEPPAKRARMPTIAQQCVEILKNTSTDFLPGNGDRIPYLLRDEAGSVTKKAYPTHAFDPRIMAVSWTKHVGIMCSFINELIQVLGDRGEFQLYFNEICNVYNSKMMYDVRVPVLKEITESVARKIRGGGKKQKRDIETDDDDCGGDDDDDDCDSDCDSDSVGFKCQFSMLKREPKTAIKIKFNRPDVIVCDVCSNK